VLIDLEQVHGPGGSPGRAEELDSHGRKNAAGNAKRKLLCFSESTRQIGFAINALRLYFRRGRNGFKS